MTEALRLVNRVMSIFQPGTEPWEKLDAAWTSIFEAKSKAKDAVEKL